MGICSGKQNTGSCRPYPLLAIEATTQKDLLAILTIDALVLIGAIALAVVQGIYLDYYFGEYRFGTYFSSLQFLLIAGVVFSIYWELKRPSSDRATRSRPNVWLLIGLGFVFLALDELFSFHEKTDGLIHSLLDIEETPVTDLLDDALVGLYVLVAAVYLLKNWTSLRDFWKTWPLFATGFVLASIMIVLDLLSNNNLFVSQIPADTNTQAALRTGMGTVEECAKILAEGFFLTGVLACRRIARSLPLRR